jgi:hypothetical protein
MSCSLGCRHPNIVWSCDLGVRSLRSNIDARTHAVAFFFGQRTASGCSELQGQSDAGSDSASTNASFEKTTAGEGAGPLRAVSRCPCHGSFLRWLYFSAFSAAHTSPVNNGASSWPYSDLLRPSTPRTRAIRTNSAETTRCGADKSEEGLTAKNRVDQPLLEQASTQPRAGTPGLGRAYWLSSTATTLPLFLSWALTSFLHLKA